MLGDYVFHYPLTDFAVGLLAIAALLEGGRIVLKRPQWQTAIDLLLWLGFGGAVASVLSGLWLVSASGHGHTRELTLHHYFAYGTLGVAALGVVAHLGQRKQPRLAGVKTVALFASAALVSAAGYFGGAMAHPKGHADDGHDMAQPAHPDMGSQSDHGHPTDGSVERMERPARGDHSAHGDDHSEPSDAGVHDMATYDAGRTPVPKRIPEPALEPVPKLGVDAGAPAPHGEHHH